MVYLLIIIFALAMIVVLFVPAFASIRARLLAGMAATAAAIGAMMPDVQGWFASLFGG